MKQRTMTYRLISTLTAVFVFMLPTILYPQSAPNTQIRNQAKAAFQYKSYPVDTVLSNQVQFTVLDAPNFELRFGTRDSTVFDKETLLVRLVYKNIGNKKADTAVINGILPPAGLRFVPGSTMGTISGRTVTWTVFNNEPGQTDSVTVKMVVDSTLSANTQLEVTGNISWLSSQTTANKIFVVSSFPRLEISNTPMAAIVGSGRSISYTIVVKNSGNVQANSVVVHDTISVLGSYQSSSLIPDSVQNNGRLIRWSLGNIPAGNERIITVDIATEPNLASGTVRNTAVAVSGGISVEASATVSVIPIAPKEIAVIVEPEYIFGQEKKDSSKIEVFLRDSIGQPMPDGVPVRFTATHGTFPNEQKTVTIAMNNGSASVYLRSESVVNEIIRSRITVTGGTPVVGEIDDTASIYLYPGAVTGKVVSGIERTPFAGAIARVYNQQKVVVGTDTTKNNGIFFVPLRKDVATYLLEIFVFDKFGDTIITTATIDPTQFPRPAIEIPNTISGRIVYRVSGQPVPAEGITVYLDSVTTTSSRSRMLPRNTMPIGVYSRVTQHTTDKMGRFKFENLSPAKYLISLDSTQFPSFSGFTFIADTSAGTFSINLSLEIQQDSSLVFALSAPASAFAGDTLTYSFTVNNNGNYLHKNIEVIDTLPSYATLISSAKGKFKSFLLDSAGNVARWRSDSLEINAMDSLHVTVLLDRNIPDSTVVINRAWFTSDRIASVGVTGSTIVKSAPIVSFGNFFVGRDSLVAGDSVYKRIWFSNTGTDSIKGIRIVDSIYAAGKSRIGLAKSQFDSVTVLDSVMVVYVGAIAPGQSDTITLRFYTDFTLSTGTTIVSSAHLMKEDSSLFNVKTTLKMVENSNIATFLTATKTGNKKVGEIGDIVTYQVAIKNNSPGFVYSVGMYDLLPHAFRYIKNSARFNGRAVEPIHNPQLNSLTWTVPDSIPVSGGATLVYQLAIGADAMESEGMNTVYASAMTSNGFTLVSAASQWQVTVRPGVFTDKGLIIGKVFYDDNRNSFQESGENGLKDVEIWMEDGTRITTGDDGKYSLPEVRPGQHVLRINERTLPPGATLLVGNSKFAKDPASQFVRLTEGGIAKANFFVVRSIADSVRQGMGKINKLISTRQAVPKYLYRDTLRNISIDTVTMIVSFVFSGSTYAQSIEVNEILPQEVSIVPNSATFNGRRVVPIILGNNVQWKLGRAQDVSQGMLKYQVVLKSFPRMNTTLLSVSSVKIVTADSQSVEGQRLITENIVKDVDKNRIETADIMTKLVAPDPSVPLSDSVMVSEGDEIFFKIALFVDPRKKTETVKLIDSLEANFVINERSFSINGVPLPPRNLSVRVRSSQYSARIFEKKEIEFTRIASADLSAMVRKGYNEISYSARLISAVKDTLLQKIAYFSVVDNFNETTITRSNVNKIYINATRKLPAIPLETDYNEIPRKVTRFEEKVADAKKLIEQLQQSSSGTVVMEGITFEAGKTTLTPESKLILDTISEMLKITPTLQLQINGHTDNTGNAVVNRKISLDRANEVRQYLIGAGIDEKRLYARGFGPDKPIASNKTEAGRSKNRRVEFAKFK
ncbi:MAG: OmpA family protein [Bacteroidota bacterium]